MGRYDRSSPMRALSTVRLAHGGSTAELVPARGGILSRFSAAGREVLFLDETTLADPAKNVRGGVPVLFPAPGKLAGGRWLRDGVPYEMKQHGFARDLPWEAVSAEPSRATLALESSAETHARFPFDFRLLFTYELDGPELRIRQRYENRSGEEMPLHAGFHPYFLVPDAEKAGTAITTRATRAFDNVTKTVVPFTGFDLTRPEVDLHLLDHGVPESTLTRPRGAGGVEITASPEFGHWVVWTLAGKDFVCVEPWTAPGDALNTGERLLFLAPGEARELVVSFRAF
jgi:galactose mutarotase-like enzyme